MVADFDYSVVSYGNQIFIQAESINQLRLSPIDNAPNYLDALPKSLYLPYPFDIQSRSSKIAYVEHRINLKNIEQFCLSQ